VNGLSMRVAPLKTESGGSHATPFSDFPQDPFL